MRVIRDRGSFRAAAGGRPAPAVAVGNFDGVHRGHVQLLDLARRRADARGAEVVVLTFDPHPARFFAPALAPPLIVSLERRIELLGEHGADCVLIEPFGAGLAALGADAFVQDVLAGDLGARDVVVGYDFSFGRGRQGNAALLAALAAPLGLNVSVVPAVTVAGLVCSSTKIRELVLEGRVEGAAMLLGRPFEITGEVVRGAARGRTLGFPTANLRPDAELCPRRGIYAARALRLDVPGAAPRPAVVNVGTNPTFDTDGHVTVEAHLIGFDGDLYGRRLRLELVRRLRDERRFASPAALAAQIADDVARARDALEVAAGAAGR